MTLAEAARYARFAVPLYGESLARLVAGPRSVMPRKAGPCGAGPRVPVTDYDPLDPVMSAEPHRYYREMLAGPAVHFSPSRRVWIVSHYDAVREALRHPEVFSSADGVLRYPGRLPTMLTTDPPEHTELRRLGTRPFTRGAIRRWEAAADTIAGEAIARMLRTPGSDVMTELAEPLPVRLIAQILGVPDEHHRAFREWSHGAVRATENTWAPRNWRKIAQTASSTARLHAYLHARLDARSGSAADDDDTALAAASAARQDGELDGDDLFLFALLLLIAGNETTTSLLGTLLLNLADHPEQYAALRANPELVPAAVEEQIRWTSPVQGLYRSALSDYELDGIAIPAGARVLLLFAAANRDPRHVERPDEFDIHRGAAQHLGFGHGIHMCLGAPLARMEAQVVLRHLIASTARIERHGEPEWSANASLRGLRRLRVTLHPGS